MAPLDHVCFRFSFQPDGKRPVRSAAEEAEADGVDVQVAQPQQHDAGRALRQEDRDGGVRRGLDPCPALRLGNLKSDFDDLDLGNVAPW